MTKSFQLFTGDGLHITHLTTKTKSEAIAYACGIVEGWKFCPSCGRVHKCVEVLDESGKIVFSKKFQW